MSGPWLVALAAWLAPFAAHPTHTSSAELVQERDSVTVAIRVFADDLGSPTESELGRYLRERFQLAERGRGVALAWRGSERKDDVVIVRLGGRLEGSLAGATVTNRVLTERFSDQVNIVRATYAGRTSTLLFVRGDGPKALP